MFISYCLYVFRKKLKSHHLLRLHSLKQLTPRRKLNQLAQMTHRDLQRISQLYQHLQRVLPLRTIQRQTQVSFCCVRVMICYCHFCVTVVCRQPVHKCFSVLCFIGNMDDAPANVPAPLPAPPPAPPIAAGASRSQHNRKSAKQQKRAAADTDASAEPAVTQTEPKKQRLLPIDLEGGNDSSPETPELSGVSRCRLKQRADPSRKRLKKTGPVAVAHRTPAPVRYML